MREPTTPHALHTTLDGIEDAAPDALAAIRQAHHAG